MARFGREWLITDRRGAFAMGTPDGIRFRKYHGFFMGLSGRSETSFLTDIEVLINGVPLWPHCYQTPEGALVYPDPMKQRVPFEFDLTPAGNPLWVWRLEDGDLSLEVQPGRPGGISMEWSWRNKGRFMTGAHLLIRPLCAMRNLHWMGGKEWKWEELDPNRAQITAKGVAANLQCFVFGDLKWKEDPLWYYNFHYEEEAKRGYVADEDVFSAGILECNLEHAQSCGLIVAENPDDLPESEEAWRNRPRFSLREPSASMDFILTRPAGICAGFPWFGEWARDTFISLPGIVAARLAAGERPEEVWSWTREILGRWGNWIRESGMLPNLIGTQGVPQWESADGTLWYCHSLAALWTFSIAEPGFFGPMNVRDEFRDVLATAIEVIRSGRHRHLRENENGLLEVTESHATWMDARISGQAVTPRSGLLPEINALWFQARALQLLWSESSGSQAGTDFSEVEEIGRLALKLGERERPNLIFLHSIPLAPSFVLRDLQSLSKDMAHVASKFWTPVGLRTLDPKHPDYRMHCVGSQEERDRAYHQGPPWGWLGGHYEMTRERLKPHLEMAPMFTEDVLSEMPIEGHVPELFDAESPFTARGAPAQAWSIACLDEAEARRQLRVDTKISEILAERWTLRGERKSNAARISKRRTRLGRGLDQPL